MRSVVAERRLESASSRDKEVQLDDGDFVDMFLGPVSFDPPS